MSTEHRDLRRFESLADRQVREAAERGEFDGLPGSGQPLPSVGPDYDPEWWAKRFIRQERARDAADDLRRTMRRELPRLRLRADSPDTRERVEELNAQAAALNEFLPLGDRIEPISLS